MDAANANYYVYIQDVTTGRTERIAGTSDNNSNLQITNDLLFSPSHTYQLWATLQTAQSPDEQQNIIVSGTGAKNKCFTVRFNQSYTEDAKNNFTTVSLKIAA